MLKFYKLTKGRKKLKLIFSSYPGIGLLNIAVSWYWTFGSSSNHVEVWKREVALTMLNIKDMFGAGLILDVITPLTLQWSIGCYLFKLEETTNGKLDLVICKTPFVGCFYALIIWRNATYTSYRVLTRISADFSHLHLSETSVNHVWN